MTLTAQDNSSLNLLPESQLTRKYTVFVFRYMKSTIWSGFMDRNQALLWLDEFTHLDVENILIYIYTWEDMQRIDDHSFGTVQRAVDYMSSTRI